MAWFDSSWGKRIPLSVDNTAGAASPKDVTFDLTLIDHLDEFWLNVQSAGEDVRVTDANGKTLETFDLLSFNTTTRTGTLEVQNMVVSGSAVEQLWLYFDNSGASTAVTSFTPGTPLVANVATERPPRAFIVPMNRERPGDLKPSVAVHKDSGETIFLYWDIEDLLMSACGEGFQGQDLFEEVARATYDIEQAGGSQASLFDADSIRFIECDGRRYVRTNVKAGTDANDYTAVLTLTTTEGRVIVGRVEVRINDVNED